MEAANSKNCAMAMRTPAAMSLFSLIKREIKASAAATRKAAPAKSFSKRPIAMIKCHHLHFQSHDVAVKPVQSRRLERDL